MGKLLDEDAVIEALEEWESNYSWDSWCNHHKYDAQHYHITAPSAVVRALPPARPEKKTGHWVSHPEWKNDGECSTTCSECEMGVDVLYNFCPRCGADMREAKVKCGDEDALQGGLMSAT